MIYRWINTSSRVDSNRIRAKERIISGRSAAFLTRKYLHTAITRVTYQLRIIITRARACLIVANPACRFIRRRSMMTDRLHAIYLFMMRSNLQSQSTREKAKRRCVIVVGSTRLLFIIMREKEEKEGEWERERERRKSQGPPPLGVSAHMQLNTLLFPPFPPS